MSSFPVATKGYPPSPLRPQPLEWQGLEASGTNHRRFAPAAGVRRPKAQRDDNETAEQAANAKHPRHEVEKQEAREAAGDLDKAQDRSNEVSHK
jgi:hypothetical protein